MEQQRTNHTVTHDTSEAALSSTLAIAKIGIATIEMLETLLPTAAHEVEREARSALHHFMHIVEQVQAHDPSLSATLQDAISGVMMAMQFQDRNTQIMDNVTGILERYRCMLQDIRGNIESMSHCESHDVKDIAENLEHILSGIRMTDIRMRYLEALKKAKMHMHTDADASSTSPQPNHDIELF